MNTANAAPARHVLIVEDDGDTRLSLRLVLEDAGYTVDETLDGATALERLRASPGGLVVLLDNLMPGLEGAEVLAALEDDGLENRHAFVLVTASPQRVTGALAERLARLSVPVVAKPFALSDLLDAVDQAARRLPAEESGGGIFPRIECEG